MALDAMPPGEDEPFPNLAEMQPPMAIDIPPHLSLWCLLSYCHEPDYEPCSGRCGGHGDYRACPHRCLCYCHLCRRSRDYVPPDEGRIRESFRVFRAKPG